MKTNIIHPDMSTEFWDSRHLHGLDGEKSDRLITSRKAHRNHLAKCQRENAADLGYAKHLLDESFPDFIQRCQEHARISQGLVQGRTNDYER